jgi:hypothetical protein
MTHTSQNVQQSGSSIACLVDSLPSVIQLNSPDVVVHHRWMHLPGVLFHAENQLVQIREGVANASVWLGNSTPNSITASRVAAMALPLPPGLTPPEIAFICEMELVTIVPRQRLEALALLGVRVPRSHTTNTYIGFLYIVKFASES